MNNRHKTIALALVGGLTLATSCKDFLDVPPQGQQTPTDFFSSNPNAATTLVNAVYAKMLD